MILQKGFSGSPLFYCAGREIMSFNSIPIISNWLNAKAAEDAEVRKEYKTEHEILYR